MRLAAVVAAALVLSACGGPPMPPPGAGDAPKQDSMAPADVAAQDAAMPAPTASAIAQDPQAGAPLEPVANDLGSAAADAWAGTWTGPEGTSLRIAKQEVGYELVITNLDGPRSFHGVAADGGIQFERDGTQENLRSGNGADTGMKWLAGKRDCLVVKPGEGYCRD